MGDCLEFGYERGVSFLETERLCFRRFTFDDLEFVLRLWNDPDYIVNVADRGIRSTEDARAYLEEKMFPECQELGYGVYLLELRGSGEAVGFCGIFSQKDAEWPHIGYAVLPEFRGKGYAGEAARALAEYGEKELKLTRLSGFTLPENDASARILMSLGMRHQRTFEMEGYEGDTAEYFVEFG